MLCHQCSLTCNAVAASAFGNTTCPLLEGLSNGIRKAEGGIWGEKTAKNHPVGGCTSANC